MICGLVNEHQKQALFFFKQKTAYDMRISDWSSDVCSSDLVMKRLRAYPTIVGVKDATGSLGRVTAQRLACGDDFCQLSGNDETALGFLAMGGKGCISVTANVAPRLCAEFQSACRSEEHTSELQSLMRISYAVFCLKKK